MVLNKLKAEVSKQNVPMQYSVNWSNELQALPALLDDSAENGIRFAVRFSVGELPVMLPKIGYEWRIG